MKFNDTGRSRGFAFLTYEKVLPDLRNRNFTSLSRTRFFYSESSEIQVFHETNAESPFFFNCNGSFYFSMQLLQNSLYIPPVQ